MLATTKLILVFSAIGICLYVSLKDKIFFKCSVEKHSTMKILLFQNVYLAVHFFIIFFSFIVSGTVYFQEEFSDGNKWQERWVLSEYPNETLGFFVLTAGKYYGHPEKSKGIQTSQDASKYGISAKFPPFSNKGKTLIVQFTVKNEQEELNCAGSYIKLFNCSLQPTLLNHNTSYLLMFGPDFCIPTTHKTHVIFNYRGKYLDLKKQIFHQENQLTHLYTLIIYPDNTYNVKIDNRDEVSGKLREDWDFLPEEYILDNTVKKPKDWDEKEIYDMKDAKPEDWEQPPYIEDPTAVVPEDWDEDIDGEWEFPLVENPDFKGEWRPRIIPNPNYKGKWVQPKIKNPAYFDDPELYKFDEICAVGIDIYQAEAGSIFDNILITDDFDYAERHGWVNWGSLRDAEKEMKRKFLEEKGKAEHVHYEL